MYNIILRNHKCVGNLSQKGLPRPRKRLPLRGKDKRKVCDERESHHTEILFMKQVPKRIAAALLNSLQGGVVPRVGLEYITVGRKAEITALLRDMELVSDGGAAFRFVVGSYGAGKSFLMAALRGYVLEKKFVVMDADLSPERRLTGSAGQGLATYRELMRNLSTRVKPDGGALELVLDRWIAGIQSAIAEKGGVPGTAAFESETRKEIFAVVREMEAQVGGFDFGQILVKYYRADAEAETQVKSDCLRWLRGEFQTRTQARAALDVNAMISDENWYDFLKLWAAFFVRAGYVGCLINIDELVNIYRLPNRVTRQNNYEKILTIYNDMLQGKARHMGVIMSATPQCLEDSLRGIYSYEALRSRLAAGRFSAENVKDYLSPVIRLTPLAFEETIVLCEKLATLHAGLYDYAEICDEADCLAFLKTEYARVGADTYLTPREVIRDFVELLNIRWQNPAQSMESLLAQHDAHTADAAADADGDDFSAFTL
jgi:hypothetical protein